ncbi:aldo/keto reductase [Chondromyces crocatus]|uniref:Aldo/keto reductase n=1 Tax=Chondromyces crocatus TaxID=52 RepID=A0A0K1EN08_CHOCO|nr:aldo/keto reductase [Chondromyces crocatus]AKT42216.1 aldo/keto reductase [Chondromyces crocatus]
MHQHTSRRVFLQTMGAGMALTACSGGAPRGPLPGAPEQGDIRLPPGGIMPTRKLGRTGQTVSLVGLGGFHIAMPKEEQDSLRIVRHAIDHGVTFMDNCWDYNEGRSEILMGKALADGYRQKVFLMTKIDGRTSESTTKQLEQSLKRLATDVIDLVQIHEIIRMEDPARCFAPGGTMEALLAAQKAGKIRYIGFTGHKDPAIHLAMLKAGFDNGFTFDSVQMPLNVMDPHYKSFERHVLPVLVEHDIGVLGMKPLGSGAILKSKTASATECLHYAMNLPTSVVITGCDSVGVLDQALAAAYDFQPLSSRSVDALLARTAPAGKAGEYEKFKTTEDFDGTTKNPHWLETASL